MRYIGSRLPPISVVDMMSHALAVQLIFCKSFADAYLSQMPDSEYSCLGCVQAIDQSESKSTHSLMFIFCYCRGSIDISVTPFSSSIEVR